MAAARHFGRLIGKLAPELDEAAAAHGEVVARALAVQLVSGIGCDVYDHAIAAAELEPAPDEARN
ncbi:MAG TPA: hypothetical protein VFY87_02390 [Geminicoccaceae bacterium]|nr:hypothetical protein [Geminicoccaceae bacterium]